MEPRISFVTLGVFDLDRALAFYRDVLELPIKAHHPGEVVFFELGKTYLALYPRHLLAADANRVDDGTGFPRFALAHNVAKPEGVGELLALIESRGGKIEKPAQKADWGGVSGYFSDPDGFLWEVAWNPNFPHV